MNINIFKVWLGQNAVSCSIHIHRHQQTLRQVRQTLQQTGRDMQRDTARHSDITGQHRHSCSTRGHGRTFENLNICLHFPANIDRTCLPSGNICTPSSAWVIIYFLPKKIICNFKKLFRDKNCPNVVTVAERWILDTTFLSHARDLSTASLTNKMTSRKIWDYKADLMRERRVQCKYHCPAAQLRPNSKICWWGKK